MESPISALAQPHIRALEAYTPGLQPIGPGWIKLNTNELPYAPPASVMAAIAAEATKLARYPEPRSMALREAIAARNGLAPSQVIIGNGSDDLLNLLARAFGGSGHQTVSTFPSYSLYPVINAIAGGQVLEIPFGEDFQLPVERLVEAETDLLFLTCPKAPTGVRFPLQHLRRLAERLRGLLVVDEAYAEFADGNAVPLLAEFPRVVVTRTFSKAYGLAGLRVGYAMGNAELIGILDRIRDSYNVNRLSQAGALAALREESYYDACIAEIRATRDRFAASLRSFGWKSFPSETNFVFTAPVDPSGRSSAECALSLYRQLEARQILVRHFARHPLTAPYLRISIGTPSEMERCLEEIILWQKTA